MIPARSFGPGILATVLLGSAATLTPETTQAFDNYIRLIESQMAQRNTGPHFLSLFSTPDDKARVRKGDLVVFSERGGGDAPDMKVPGGMIHDWTGAIFVPGATLAQARAVMQDYDNYRTIYAPDVIDSRLLARRGDEFRVFLRLREKQIVTVVYNTEYTVDYAQRAAGEMTLFSRSTRIAEVRDPGQSLTDEDPVGDDDGFLWRLNSYWHFEEADGGVYAECRAVTLSRGLPLGFGWLRGFIQQFPKQSMMDTLNATKRAIAGRARTG